MENRMKIGIAGCAGSGKTSFAEALAKMLQIPFLKSKDITYHILNRDGYDYSSGIQIERFLANTGRQTEILRRTMEQQSVESFVTDRTTIDLAAYAVSEMNSDPVTVKHIYDTCKRNAGNYTHLLLCPWRETPITDNKKRTLNPWYQLLIHATERGIMDDWGCKYYVIETIGTENRLEEARKVLGINELKAVQ